MTLTPPPQFDPDHPRPQDLLWAYRHGVFPMADPLTGLLEWFCPARRGVIPLDAFHVPKNLAREVRQRRFAIRCDSVFEQVMQACAEPRESDGLTWIDERLIDAYVGLHALGNAHSIEAWLDGALVGGLYGVQVGAAFFGESMFSRPDLGGTNASKVCLVHLVQWLTRRGFTLLDTQFANDHLVQFGCVEIPREEYLKSVSDAMKRPVDWGRFDVREA